MWIKANRKPVDLTPEEALATSIVIAAVKDLLAPTKRDRMTSEEAFEFLTGQTEMSQFWLAAADCEPLTGTAEEIRARLARDLDGLSYKQLIGLSWVRT